MMTKPTVRQFANDDFTMLSRTDYFQTLATDIAAAKKSSRVVAMTMGISPTYKEVQAVADAFNGAAKRGVATTFLMDAFDFLIDGDTKALGPLWFSPHMHRPFTKEPFRSRQAALQALADSGGHYTITNQPGRAFVWPYRGRSHIKAAVVGDIVYLGGCNFNHPEELDIMLRWRDAKAADWLYERLLEIAEVGVVREALHSQDATYTLDPKTRIIIDAGVAHQSAIFDEALDMINNAKEWIVFTSQYFAPGVGTQALARALERGVKITYYYSHHSMHGPIEGRLHQIAQWRERHRLPAQLFEKRLPRGVNLHAKLLATEQGALIGSHNYGDLGVQLGTAEIALKRNDLAFARKAVNFIEQQINAAA